MSVKFVFPLLVVLINLSLLSLVQFIKHRGWNERLCPKFVKSSI